MRRLRTLLRLEQLESRELLSANYFPDTSGTIGVFSDQLNQGFSNQLVQFISSHYAGTQKMLPGENARYVADNPNWTLLSYRLADASGPAPYILNGQWGSDWSTETQNESWFMHDPTGQRLYDSQFDWDLNDISNPQWQQYWINSTIANMRADGSQGVFADSFTAGIGGGWFTTSDPRFTGTNPATPSAWPNGVTWVQQQQNLINAVESAFAATPEHFKYIPNLDAMVTGWYNLDTSKLDGAFLEHFGEWGPAYLDGSSSDWTLSMNRALSMTDAGKTVILQSSLLNPTDSTNGLLQRGFDLGSYLLLKGDHTYINMISQDDSSSWAWYYPEYGINLGNAVTPLATDVSQYQWDGVYRRDFQNGVVLVNPTDSSVTVNVGQTYNLASFSGGGALTDASLDANGNYVGGTLSYSPVQTITLAPGSAAILLGTPNQPPPPPPAGLVAAYNFDEGSGTVLHDYSGNGNNGTVSNATWGTGKYGGALSFNGTNAWVTINDSPSLDLTNGMTLEAWVDPTANAEWRPAIVKQVTGDLSYGLYAQGGGTTSFPPAAQLNVGGGDQTAQAATGLTTNAWNFLAATYNGSTLSIYVNGNLVSSTPASGNIFEDGGVLRIGGDSSWNEYFKGLIDNVRIYNCALSQSSIQADMNTPVPGTSSSGPKLVAAYNFNEGSGTVLHDYSGNGNNGTVSNATWSTSGKYGGALSFNGSNAWVTINDSSSLDLTNGMTLEAWVDPTANAEWRPALIKELPGTNPDLSYGLYAQGGGSSAFPPAAQLNVGGGDQTAQAATGLTTNAWNFLAATYNGSTLSIYVNGNLVSSTPVTGPILENGGVLRIGGDASWNEYFKGLIDNVRIYNGALSQSSIQADMNTPV